MEPHTMEQKRATLTARTTLPANVSALLRNEQEGQTDKATEETRPRPTRPSSLRPSVPSSLSAKEYTLALRNVAPPAESQLNVTIDAALKQRLEDAVFRHRRARSAFGTQRGIVESALEQWLELDAAEAA